MKKIIYKIYQAFIKIILYITVLIFFPKEAAEAVNKARTPEEMEDMMFGDFKLYKKIKNGIQQN